ncbi:hypothetical protein A3A20_01945 [Candidatus Wolfebacteria bacterium RIFCSPLOWO2_01_FULL_45_19]|uniref:VIT family protein n=1 Tax=Candidatus Wolfebacteria bacterium RIFCSPLOWO2_01_FULL_45_19 TaxID=1802557 RepID=A0A1F8DSR8_9BACT|nr:MAG: hypothetical protein UX23_C0001G0030 [Parcubacteria group bacterium GW2011_GWB1_45_9]OGM91677.1 MAG: hypothetical protein A3A20_01945 [Candidatus Wolfebacteria bacterium RIFCSPLOWO2_01_FULL_45_19]
MKEKTHGKFLSRHIKDIIYGANDGIITTFAIVAGVAGAALSVRIILILGFANLIADGISMAASNYLGGRSEAEMMRYELKLTPEKNNVIVSGALTTFFAFVFAGAIPLLPFILLTDGGTLFISSIATAFALFAVGAARSLITAANWFVSGLEMLVIGGIAASAAYFIGFAVSFVV